MLTLQFSVAAGANKLLVYSASCTGLLPAEAMPQPEYAGRARVFVPTIRSLAEKGEQLRISATVLAASAALAGAQVVLLQRPMGSARPTSNVTMARASPGPSTNPPPCLARFFPVSQYLLERASGAWSAHIWC